MICLVTGGFDPIHSGHLRYFEDAKTFSDRLVVGLNSNEWLIRKKGQYFLPWYERADIISHLDMVDSVISWDDADDSACGAISKCLEKYVVEFNSDKVVFCNGGDRAEGNTPELDAFENDDRVLFVWGVGGNNKMNSSSLILENYFNRQRKLLGI